MERVGPDDFVDAAYRSIFQLLVDDPEVRHAPEGMDAGAARRLEELLGDAGDLHHPGEVFEASVSRMLEAGMEARLDELDRKLKEAGSFDEQRALLEERARLTRESRAGRVDGLPAARHSARVRQGGEGAAPHRQHAPGTVPGRGTEPE
jgi:hypothetical protein